MFSMWVFTFQDYQYSSNLFILKAYTHSNYLSNKQESSQLTKAPQATATEEEEGKKNLRKRKGLMLDRKTFNHQSLHFIRVLKEDADKGRVRMRNK